MAPECGTSIAPSNQEKVKLVPAEVLIERGQKIHDLIARRAYEIFEQRGRVHGSDIGDWLWAESELLRPCRHELKELPEAFILKAEMPGGVAAAELELSAEPRRLMISGEGKVEALCVDADGTHSERMPERIFRIHELPGEIDPSRTVANVCGKVLEVVMPKAAVAGSSMRHEPEL